MARNKLQSVKLNLIERDLETEGEQIKFSFKCSCSF